MPMHFGRFRILNETQGNGDPKPVVGATLQVAGHPATFSAVGAGSLFPTLEPGQYSTEDCYDEEIEGTELVVTVQLQDGPELIDWHVSMPGDPLLSEADFLVFFDGTHYVVRAVLTAWNYNCEVTENTLQ